MNKRPITIRLDVELLEAAKVVGHQDKKSVTQVLTDALVWWLRQRHATPLEAQSVRSHPDALCRP